MMVDIAGIDKAKLLCGLYNAAITQGMGFLQYEPGDMSEDEAQRILDDMPAGRLRFDYLKGRVLKVNITHDEFETAVYNRDNGQNAAENVVSDIRHTFGPAEVGGG